MGGFPSPHNVEPLRTWEPALKTELASASPVQAADRLASGYGLPPPAMRELVELWLYAKTRWTKWDDKPGPAEEMRARIGALLAATGRAALVREAAAVMVEDIGKCDPADLDRLVSGASDPLGEAWLAARSADCAGWYGRFAAMAPGKAAGLLILLAAREEMARPIDSLPVLAWLTGDAAMARIRESDWFALGARLNHDFLLLLFSAGLAKEAIAAWERLPEAMRAETLAGSFAAIDAEADGLEFHLPESRLRGMSYFVGTGAPNQRLKAHLAAALALRGRTEAAKEILASVAGIDEVREAYDCAWSLRPRTAARKRCDYDAARTGELLLLDHFLHRGGEDPYPLAEAFFAGGQSLDPSAVFADLQCRIFTEPKYSSICASGRARVAGLVGKERGWTAPATAAAVAAVDAAGVDRISLLRRDYEAKLHVAAMAYGGEPPSRPVRRGRTAVAAEPPPFAKHAIPPAYRREGPAVSAGDFAPLPEGYEAVRWVRERDRVAAISVSQNLDPTGEASRGGYWIHLSSDRGKSWEPPLYTGLAEYFPYVVLPRSALPLFDGDTLNLAVEGAQLDTSTISYPPVSTRTGRSEPDHYLRIPLADLRRDSDGDGITDIAARHLLIDRAPSPETGTPLLVGSAGAARCEGPPSPEQRAMAALLEDIFGTGTGGIVEPPDRPKRGSVEGMAAAWRRTSNSADRPVFVVGDPPDFRCLRLDRPLIVYSESDLERLRRFTPDFHAVSMDRIVFNRSGDRGYVSWSAGWRGGTERLLREGDGWVVQSIQRWIT